MEPNKQSNPTNETQGRMGNGDIRTQQNLSKAYCEQNFKCYLRGDGLGSKEVNSGMAYFNPKPRQRREQVSHVFTGEPDIEAQNRPGKKMIYKPSNVMFNDEYVENNPKISNKMKVRYEREKELKSEKHQQYSDEPRYAPEKQASLQRKIKDTYGSNPMVIMTPEDNQKMNIANSRKVEKRAEVIGKYMGGNSIKKTMTTRDPNGNKESFSEDKITNGDFNSFKNALDRQKNEPNFKRRGFQVATGANGSYAYMY